jgi:hypothetical protein
MRIVRRLLICVASLALLIAALPASARADQFDKETLLTFSQPVSLPGVTLAAGTYRFQLANPNGDPSIVQVTNARGNVSYGMFITVPEPMPTAANEPGVTLTERAKGAPEAIQSWTYPGDEVRWTFVYPRR